MTVIQLAFFGATLLFGPVALLKWNYRREAVKAERMNRGLREYLSADQDDQLSDETFEYGLESDCA